MSMQETLAENRRLIILRALDEVPAYEANETVLKTVTGIFGHRATKDQIRADFMFLSEHGLICIKKVSAEAGEVWIAKLLTPGQEVAQGRPHPGVARREPG